MKLLGWCTEHSQHPAKQVRLMIEFIYIVLAAIVACACWYCYRCGHTDGRADGYLSGDAVSKADGHAVKQGET